MSLKLTNYIKRLKSVPSSPLGEGFGTCAANPDIINLGTAENRVMGDMLQPILVNREGMVPYDVTYSAGFNDKPLREALAALYREFFHIEYADASQILMGSGIAYLVEKLGLVLCDESDAILIPKPCYGCFEPDLAQCGAYVEYIDLNNLPEKPPENARLLILTNPGNPIGDTIENPDKLLEWCYQNPELHIVSDDVYALSNRRNQPFVSIAGLPNARPDVVHHYYGMSKDWGLAGCHVGFFMTRNQELFDLMKIGLGCFHLSSDTQWLCTKLLDKSKGIRDPWIKLFKERLISNEAKMISMLKESGIKYRPCDNSLFLLIDLRDIVQNDPDKELQVWRELMNKYRVHILPCHAGFHLDEPGFYRVIFSIPKDELEEGINRLIKGIKEIRQNSV